MKRILFSLMTLVLVVGMVGAGALAYFSDVETSSGNSFTAGTLDLVVTTSGVCSDVGKVTVNENGDGINDNVVFANLAPGDSGSITWTLTNTGSLPGKILINQTLTNDSDGINTEPELLVDADLTVGELDNNMVLVSTGTLDGVPFEWSPWTGWMSDITSHPIVDNIDGTRVLPAGKVLVLTYSWSIPTTVENIIQGDTFTANFTFTLAQ